MGKFEALQYFSGSAKSLQIHIRHIKLPLWICIGQTVVAAISQVRALDSVLDWALASISSTSRSPTEANSFTGRSRYSPLFAKSFALKSLTHEVATRFTSGDCAACAVHAGSCIFLLMHVDQQTHAKACGAIKKINSTSTGTSCSKSPGSITHIFQPYYLVDVVYMFLI